MIRIRFLCGMTILLISCAGCARMRGKQVLSRTAKAYAQARTLEIWSHVQIKVRISDQTNTTERDVHFVFERPARFRMESRTEEGSSVTVSDGQKLIIYSGLLGQYIVRDAPVHLSDVARVTSLRTTSLQLPAVTGILGYDTLQLLEPTEPRYPPLSVKWASSKKLGDVRCHRLFIRLVGNASQQLWIGVHDFLIRKSVLRTPTETLRYASLGEDIPRRDVPEPGGEMSPRIRESIREALCTITEEVKSVRRNVRLDPDLFQFSPPSAARRVARFDFSEFTRRRSKIGLLLGKPAPDFVLTDLDGIAVNLKRYRGRVVLLSFWLPAAPRTAEQISAYREAGQFLQTDQVVFLSVSPVRNVDAVRRAVEKHHVPGEVLVDTTGVTGSTYATKEYPRTLIIDVKGIVRADYQGPVPAERLLHDLSKAGVEVMEPSTLDALPSTRP